MYKVLLVDDEFWICQGLKIMADWTSLDMKVIAAVDNALAALQVCQDEMPDVIITDINMPKMNGLEMIDRLHKLCPEAVVIIISGHDEFTYAQKAVSLHVFDYLLKPIDLGNLTDVLNRAKAQLVKQREAQQTTQRAQELLKSNRRVLLDWTVNNLLRGRLEKSQLTDIQVEVLSAIEHLYTCVILLEISLREKNSTDIPISEYTYLAADIETLILQCDYAVLLPKDFTTQYVEFYVCLFHKEEDKLAEYRDSCVQRLWEAKNTKGHDVTISYGEIQRSAQSIRVSAKQAETAIQKKLIYGKNKVYSFQPRENAINTYTPNTVDGIQYSEIAEHVIFNEQINFNALFSDIRDLVQLAEDPYIYLHGIIQNLEFRLLEELNKVPFGMEFQFNPFSMTHEITQNRTLDGALLALQRQLEDLIAKIATRQKAETNTYIDKAIYYMNTHYADSELNLRTVAKIANMSISYFCSKFKEVTGSSCISYLIGIRIEKAKTLLRNTDMKVHEVAAAVGYINSTYFCTLFKNNQGCTPEAYRKRAGQSEN